MRTPRSAKGEGGGTRESETDLMMDGKAQETKDLSRYRGGMIDRTGTDTETIVAKENMSDMSGDMTPTDTALITERTPAERGTTDTGATGIGEKANGALVSVLCRLCP